MGGLGKFFVGCLMAGAFAASLLFAAYFFEPAPCSSPVAYRIGAIDPRFGVSADKFRKDIAAANRIWSARVGHDLFRYSDDAPLAINLVYDWRQDATQSEGVAAHKVD